MATASREHNTLQDLPRDPSAYRPGIHFTARFHDRYEDDRPPRHLDEEIVRTCIEEGAARSGDGNAVWLRDTFGGVDYRIVVNPDTKQLVTGYPVAIDREEAWLSGRWTTPQLNDIEEFIATDPRQHR
jgi:hypothetical protein